MESIYLFIYFKDFVIYTSLELLDPTLFVPVINRYHCVICATQFYWIEFLQEPRQKPFGPSELPVLAPHFLVSVQIYSTPAINYKGQHDTSWLLRQLSWINVKFSTTSHFQRIYKQPSSIAFCVGVSSPPPKKTPHRQSHCDNFFQENSTCWKICQRHCMLVTCECVCLRGRRAGEHSCPGTDRISVIKAGSMWLLSVSRSRAAPHV